MRRVYHSESNTVSLLVAISCGLAFTAVLFIVIPFAHQIAKPERTLELRKGGVVDLPPPTQDETQPPTPPAEEKAPEPAPELAEAPPQALSISADLEVALGSGGALAGLGDFRATATEEAGTGNEAFDVSDLERRPEPVAQTAPTYPRELAKAKVEGSVTVAFVIDEQGQVADPRVETSSRPEFEKPALEAIRRWRFKPGEREGKAVRTFVKQPFRFSPPR
jgi:protein TonB